MPYKRHVTIWCTLARSFGVNQKTLSRVNQTTKVEFFYHSMPSLGKDLERGLRGQFILTAPFKRQSRSALPQFLYELFIKIFDKQGRLLLEPNGIQELRQLLMMFYKFVTPIDDQQIRTSELKFINTDKNVKTDRYPFGLSAVRKHFLSVLPDNPFDIRGHHSNGATADRITNEQKRFVRRYIPSLMKTYDPTYFFNSLHHASVWSSCNKTVIAEPAARLSFVPKDSRGPRAICMEPHERMFIQKGLQTLLYDHIEKYSPAKGYINFSDQSINQYLAYEASITGSYATIDLKDASDLVPWNLIRLLVSPEWYCALESTRSPVVTLPSGNSLSIQKFASMGSALCFPIEAILFWSIARTVCPEVYVYGDDIIVRTEYAHDVIKALTSYGLIVNEDKTLTTGFFRESCGAEFYNGRDISYVKCKSYDAVEFIAFCNNITKKFGVNASYPLIKLFELINGPVWRDTLDNIRFEEPMVYYTTDSLRSNDVFFRRRYNVDLQRYEFRRQLYTAVRVRTKRRFLDSDSSDLLYDWYVQSSTLTPNEDFIWRRLNYGLHPDADYTIRRIIKRPYRNLSSVTDHGEVSLHYKYTWV